jgi:O-antigen/teichoic acid export membrane protein
VVPVVAAAYALSALQFCVAPGIHIGGRTRALSVIGIVAAVSNLGLGLVMIPALGMMGAAWATVGAFALAFVGAAWLAQRSHPVRYELGRLARIVAAGLVAYTLMRLVPPGAWLLAGQVGVLGVFVVLLLISGFVAPEEREYLAELVHRYVPLAGRQQGA